VSEADPFADIRGAVERRFGHRARIENISVPTLGGSNRTVIFDLVETTGRRRLVSRQETYQASDSPFRSPIEQFRVMQIAHGHGFPVPEPVFAYEPEDGAGQGFVTGFVAGETMPKRILGDPGLAEARERLAEQAGRLLAQLHAISAAEAALLETCADSADTLAAHRDRFDHYAEAHPAIELGLRWLETHRPDSSPRVLVHGDFRLGNLMVGPDGIRAVLDWECTHLGSAMEDLGWLCTRSWRFGGALPVGGFGTREALFAGYEAGGGTVYPAAVRWWEIFGLMRWAVLNVMQAHGHVFGGRRSVVFAACGRNTALVEYDLLMTLAGRYD
jgi:aminoglycoside phosphotransferase (APT) family kinase protein